MGKYELVVIYDPYLQDADYENQIGKLTEAITKRGGTIANSDIWGRRALAYPIAKKSEGYYAILTIEGAMDATALSEIERSLRLNETVLREMLVKVPEPKPEKPSKKKAKAAAAEGERRVFTETRSAGDAGASVAVEP